MSEEKKNDGYEAPDSRTESNETLELSNNVFMNDAYSWRRARNPKSTADSFMMMSFCTASSPRRTGSYDRMFTVRENDMLMAAESSDGYNRQEKESKGYDTTRYTLAGDGFRYKKNALVLACVKKYVEEHNPTYAQLKEAFPDRLQGTFGVVQPVALARQITGGKRGRDLSQNEKDESYRKRYFTDADSIIRINNEEYVVSNQWTKDNIDRFIDHVRSRLHMDITEA